MKRLRVEWLDQLLNRNSGTSLLRQYGAPLSLEEFRANVPLCTYADLLPFLRRIEAGEPDVLFSGVPVAYERTGGSTEGPKLIPYSAAGLLDFQRNIQPWLERTFSQHAINGKVYFSISPATRKPEYIGAIPVGLPDAAYLGSRLRELLASRTAVPFEVANIEDISRWRDATISHLLKAYDLELISVWSPTFLLHLLEHIPDAAERWPSLKVVSCWAAGPSQAYAEQVRNLLPQAYIEPKGLMSTEAIMTVPDVHGKPIPAAYGFMEFLKDGNTYLTEELVSDDIYEVVVTTASGLYRYRTGDLVRFDGLNDSQHPVLEFVGRNSLVCDLVGEKLTEPFVRRCLEKIAGFVLMIPDTNHPGYVLVCDRPLSMEQVTRIESCLRENPQYAYARDIGQLAPMRVMASSSARDAYEKYMLDHSRVRMGDIKPVSLRKEGFWLPYFMEQF